MIEGRELIATRRAIQRLGDRYRAGRLTRTQFIRAVLRKGGPWHPLLQDVLYLAVVEAYLGEHFCELWREHDCESFEGFLIPRRTAIGAR